MINVYGQQEGRMSKEMIEQHWDEIVDEIGKIEEREEWFLLAGDFNRHLGNSIPGNLPTVSYGGKLINSFLESPKYKLLNATNKTVGGPWTRTDPAHEESKSILDYVIVSSDLEKYLVKMEIDKDRRFTAFKRNKDGKLSFPDHFAIELLFEGIPRRNEKIKLGKNYTIWNTNKQDGWSKYKELTTNNMKLDRVATDSIENPDIIMSIIERELNDVKHKAFGKVKVKKRREVDELKYILEEKDNLIKNKNSNANFQVELEVIDDKISKAMKDKQKREYEKAIENVKSIKSRKGVAGAVFNVKDKIIGRKKDSDEPTAVVNPKTNRIETKPSTILKVCADYVEELLTNKEPRESFKDVEWKRIIHDIRMKERNENEIPFSRELFNSTFKQLKSKGGSKYNFILKAGKSLHDALFKLYEVVWNVERIPKTWKETVIVQLNKSESNKTDLNKKRHIHTKKDVAKYFGHMVTSTIKPTIVNNISPFQIGAIPGHRSQEHLYNLKSVVMMMEKNGDAVATQLLDLVKYFDSENLLDNLNELYKSNIRGKSYRLIHELNKETKLKVRNAIGESDERKTKEGMAQGSIDAGIVSSNNLSKGVEDFFASSQWELFFGPLRLLPQSFQDDLMRYCKDPLSAQYGLDRFEHLAESKVLQYNETKSFIIILGAKGARRRLKKEFQDNPPTLYGRPMQIVDNQSYLGDQIGFSNAESITLTLNKRLGIARKAVFDIKTVLEDSRSTVAGGIKTGILLWES